MALRNGGRDPRRADPGHREPLRTIALDDLDQARGGILCQQLAPMQWGDLIQSENSGKYTGWHGKGNGYWGAYGFSPKTWKWIGMPGEVQHASPHLQDVGACKLYCKEKGGGPKHWDKGHLIAGTPCPSVIE